MPLSIIIAIIVFLIDWLAPGDRDFSGLYLLALLPMAPVKRRSAFSALTFSLLALLWAPMVLPLGDTPDLFTRLYITISLLIGAFFLSYFSDMVQKTELISYSHRYRTILHHASIGIMTTNTKGVITEANRELEHIFGYEAGELRGKPISVLIPNDKSGKHDEHYQHFLRNPVARTMGMGRDLYGKRKDGTIFPVEVSLNPLNISSEEAVMAFVVDNTGRKRYELELIQQKKEVEALNDALEEVNRSLEKKVDERTRELLSSLVKEKEINEMKTRFVSMASHEFRTPLSGISSSASLIESYAQRGDADKIMRHTRRILHSVESLTTILNEFLSLGKLEEGKAELRISQVNITDLIDDACEDLKYYLKSGQKFVRHHEGDPVIQSDSVILKNILLNLISNACKYSPENKPITIKSVVTGTKIVLEVIDQGSGLSEEEQAQLFKRFFRASNSIGIQGTGLGLYIVKRYIEILKGKIEFESRLGEGTLFRVVL